MTSCDDCGRKTLNGRWCFDCHVARFPDVARVANISTNDPFRRYHLSTAKSSEQVRQQRAIAGPQDTFEARRMERDLGRKYIGDDAGELRPSGQRAVDKWKDRVKNGEVRA